MGSYGDAMVEARRLLADARLADRDEHYPYKHDVVTELVIANPPMGPDGPSDDRLTAEDYTSVEIADASRYYVDAQALYLNEPNRLNLDAYRDARDRLVAARQAHRANRPVGANIVGIRARRSGE